MRVSKGFGLKKRVASCKKRLPPRSGVEETHRKMPFQGVNDVLLLEILDSAYQGSTGARLSATSHIFSHNSRLGAMKHQKTYSQSSLAAHRDPIDPLTETSQYIYQDANILVYLRTVLTHPQPTAVRTIFLSLALNRVD